MKWNIGTVEIDNQVVLAPMAGICDSPFRTIAKSMGCGLICTEMVSDRGLIYDNTRTQDMLQMTDYERPISQQIFGSTPETMKNASAYIYEHMHPDIIDINMGCPVRKVAIKGQSGSALLKDPDKAYKIVCEVVDTVPVPVTVKIRSGWDKINALEMARLIEDAGASAITVHPRTKEQSYCVDADWSIIKDVKNEVSIPVIGNGDIRTCFDAKRMLDETSCDAIMIGRATLGNPWLIKQCVEYLDNGTEPKKVTKEERFEMIKRHTELLFERKPEKVAISKMRVHAAYYLKGLYRSVEIKPKLFKTTTKEELYDLIEDYLKILNY
ncbi:TIM barrel oxidoreductase NifR3 [Methanobrevibacter sp. YE315]|uniref:tRNA dihydrouridine synthase DusB n=1 Tax=Methanobrevibacter sp. YE315 TaxID=1609968 RepID=UPI000764D1F7|nr:tRNA dihydrouridine synthase DusB [Methanobrevibacter sp. YE315]AMD18285.1 TIM barrel oxidoreductase NifR3 [Methanobrevibacter sp. YE315]